MPKYERQFSKQIRDELSEVFGKEIFVQLFPDMRRTGKKPFDFFFIYKGGFYAIECKLSEGNSFNIMNGIAPHQPSSLRNIIEVGGFAYFAIYFNRYDATFLCTPDMLDYIEEKVKSDRITYEEFEKYATKMSRIKIEGSKRWEVEKMTIRSAPHSQT